MKLNVKALALTAGILWAACFFVTGVANLLWPTYGAAFLTLGASIYPGYHGPTGFGSVIVVTLYALLDGSVCGAVFAWLYNTLSGVGQRA
jgi:hypothetical protein